MQIINISFFRCSLILILIFTLPVPAGTADKNFGTPVNEMKSRWGSALVIMIYDATRTLLRPRDKATRGDAGLQAQQLPKPASTTLIELEKGWVDHILKNR